MRNITAWALVAIGFSALGCVPWCYTVESEHEETVAARVDKAARSLKACANPQPFEIANDGGLVSSAVEIRAASGKVFSGRPRGLVVVVDAKGGERIAWAVNHTNGPGEDSSVDAVFARCADGRVAVFRPRLRETSVNRRTCKYQSPGGNALPWTELWLLPLPVSSIDKVIELGEVEVTVPGLELDAREKFEPGQDPDHDA